MSKQLSNLRTATRIYLDEATAADWLDSEVDLAINLSYHDVVSFVMEVYQQFYETTTPFTYALVANTQEYVVDPSLIKVTRVEVNLNPTTSGSLPSRAQPMKMDEVRANLANTNNAGSFYNAGYYLHGPIGSQKVGLIPLPSVSDTGGAKSLSVWGIALPSDLVNASDDVNIPYADRFSYLVSLKAAAQLLRKGQQEEQAAARYLAEYRAGVQDLMTFLSERTADDVWQITDSTLEDIDFGVLEAV